MFIEETHCHPITFENVDCVLVHCTNDCNLYCKYCYVDSSRHNDNSHMSLAMLEEACRMVFHETKKSAIAIIFHGGEPLLLGLSWYRAAIKAVQSLAAEHRKIVEFNIQSNGTLIHDEFASFFQEKNVTLGVSLDGPATIHNAMRGQFGRTMLGIEKLRRSGVHFGIICVVSTNVMQNSQDVLSFFENQEIGNVQFNFLHQNGRGRRERGLGAEQRFLFQKVVLDHMLARDRHRVVDSHTKRQVLAYSGQPRPERRSSCHQPTCSGGIEFIAVTSDGSVHPCGCALDPKWELTTLGGKDRVDYSTFFRSFHTSTYRRKCADCSAAVICDHGCPGVEKEDKNFFDNSCEATRKFYAYLESRKPEVLVLAEQLDPAATKGQGKDADSAIPLVSEESREGTFHRLFSQRELLFNQLRLKNEIFCSIAPCEGKLLANIGGERISLDQKNRNNIWCEEVT